MILRYVDKAFLSALALDALMNPDVIDVCSAAARLGLVPGMPLRRAHRIAPRTRFLPASYDNYQPIIQKLKERYRTYSAYH